MGCISSKQEALQPQQTFRLTQTSSRIENQSSPTYQQSSITNQNQEYDEKEKDRNLKKVIHSGVIDNITDIISGQSTSNLKEFILKRKQNLKIFKTCYSKNKDYYKKFYNLIKETSITFAELKQKFQEFCLANECSMKNLLFLSNSCGFTLMEIFIQQRELENLKELWESCQLGQAEYSYIGLTLFKKIKQNTVKTKTIQQSQQQQQNDKEEEEKRINQIIEFMKNKEMRKIIDFILLESYQRKQCQDIINNLLLNLKIKNKKNLKLIKLLASIQRNFLQNQLVLQKYLTTDQIILIKQNEVLFQEYNNQKQKQIFSEYKIPIIFQQKNSEITSQQQIKSKTLLLNLEMNLFHQISLNKKWDIFSLYCNSFYFQPDQSGRTPFMYFFQFAPFQIINEYITKFPQSLQEGLKYQSKQKLNLIHCFCMNKNLKDADSECRAIIIKIIPSENLEMLLNSEYNEQIPLIIYLNRQDKPDNEIINFLSKFLVQEFNLPKLDIYASLYGDELKQKIKYIKYQAEKESKFQFNVPKINKIAKQFQNSVRIPDKFLQEVDLLYHHFIQLQKLSLKQQDLIQRFPFLNQYGYLSIPDTVPEQETFQNILFRYLSNKKESELFNKIDFPNIILQYKQSIQMLKQNIKLIEYFIESKFPFKEPRNDKITQNTQNSLQVSEQLMKEFNCLYHHFIQLQKLSIKHPELIQRFPHLTQYFIFTSFFPYQIATQHETFYNILFRHSSNEKVSELLNKIDFLKIIQQYKQSIQMFKIDLPEDYSVECQILAKMLIMKKDLKSLEHHTFINKQIITILKFDPRLIFNKIYGQSWVKLLKSQTTLYQLILTTYDFDLYEQAVKLALDVFTQENNLDFFNQQVILHHLQFHSPNSNKEQIDEFIKKFPLKLEEGLKKFKQFKEDSEIPELQLDQYFKILVRKNFRNLNLYLKDPLKLVPIIFSGNEITKLMIIPFKQFINKHIDFFLPKLWANQLGSDEDILNHLNLGQSKRITIQFLFYNQFQRFYYWQRMGVEFLVINFEKTIQHFNQETQLIYLQLFNNLDFCMTLALDDDLKNSLQQYCEQFPEKIEKISYTKIPLHLMLRNQALGNINYFIDIFQLNRAELINILAENYFNQSNLLKIEGSEFQNKIESFNQQLSEILNMNIQNHYDSEKILIPLIKYVRYIEYDVFIQLNQELRTNLFFNNEFKNIFSLKEFDLQKSLKSYFNISLHSEQENRKIQKIFLIDCINQKKQEDDNFHFSNRSTFLTKATIENPEFSEYILENLTQQDLENLKQLSCNFLLKFFQLNQNKIELYISKINLSQKNFFQNYCYALSIESFQSLNILLNYLENSSYSKPFKQVYYYYMKKVPLNYQHYLRALNKKYYLVLTTEQYKTFLNQIVIDTNQKITQIKFFILLGYHKKLSALLSFVDKDLNMDEIFLALIYRKKMFLQSIFNYELSYLNKNLEDRINNLQEWFEKTTKKKLNQYCLFYEQDNSQENFWQDIDHQLTFNLMDSYFQRFNIQNELMEINQYFSLLLNPQAKAINQKQIMVDSLIQLFSSRKCIISKEFIKQRQQSYIELFNSNENQTVINFELKKPHLNSYKFIENILVKIVQKEKNLKSSLSISIIKFTQFILQYNFLREELVELVQEGAKQFQIKIFDKTTLFYFQKNVCLLPLLSYDFSKYRFFQHRYLSIQDITKMNDLDLSLLTPTQVFLCKGKLDHIKILDLKYSNQNLLAALISNNFETIITIINLHPNPIQLIQQTNIFQILIQFQNEKNVQYFYNKFLVNKQKDFYKQILNSKEQMLYIMIFQNKQQVFENAFFPCMCQGFGEQKTIEILKLEIQKQTKDGVKLYQLALIQKSYFMLEFMDEILQSDEIQERLQSFSINFFDQPLFLKQSKLQKFSSFKNLYDENRSILSLMPFKYQPDTVLLKKRKHYEEIDMKKNKNWRNEISERILELLKICMYHLFGFQNEISLLMQRNFGYFKLFQQNQSDLKVALKLCQGNIQLFQIFKSKFKIDQNLVKEIFLTCSEFYLLQNPFFHQQIIIFPQEFFQLLRIADYNLEISLLIALKLQNNQEFLKFLQKQIDMTNQSLEHLSGIDRIPENILFVMSILNNIFNSKFIENFDNVTIELLIRTNNFINQQFGKISSKFSDVEAKYILSLMKKSIIFKDPKKFMDILKTQDKGHPIIIGLLYIKEIENLIDEFQMSLPIQIRSFVKVIQVSFNNELSFDLQKQLYLIPIKFVDDHFLLQSQIDDKILENIKLKLFEENKNQNIDELAQMFPIFNLKEIPKQINVNLVPLSFFEKENQNQKCCQQKQKSKLQRQNKKSKNNDHPISKEKQNQEEYNDDGKKLLTKKDLEIQIQEKISQFDRGLLERMIFFKKLMIPFPKQQRNHELNDLNAPHQFHLQINGSKGEVQYQEQTLPNIQKVEKESSLTNQGITSDKIEKTPVLFEFYHYVFPTTFQIQLIPLTEKEFEQKYNQKEILQSLIFKFCKYKETFKQHLKTGQFNYGQTIDLPFYIQEEKIVYQKVNFTPYAFQAIFSKLYDSMQLISQLNRNSDQEIQWRFHSTSILKVVIKPYLEFFDYQKLNCDIFGLIDQFCIWKNLSLLLNQIINYNIKNFSKINSIVQNIQVKFIALNEQFSKNFKYQKYQLLDHLFFFGRTQYVLKKQTLIIKLAIGKHDLQNIPQIEPQFSQQKYNHSNLFKLPDESVENYQINIIDETNFLFQIFSPEKLVLFMFKSTQLNKKFQDFSKQLRNIYNKSIIFTANYQDLINLFAPKINRLLEKREGAIFKQRVIKNQIQSIRKDLKQYCFHTFVEAITNNTFTQIFYNRLSVLMQSLRQKKSFSQQISQNERKLVKGNKSKVIEKVGNFSKNVILPFHFGFQVSTQYFMQIGKLACICLIVTKQSDEQVAQIKAYQFIGQIENRLKFYSIEEGREILTQAMIQDSITLIDAQDDKQIKNKYEIATLSILVDEILSIIVFEKFWPLEINYSEIQNVFFTDANGSLIICHENNFLRKMSFIQQIEDEKEKQQILDNCFGENQIQVYDQISLAEMIPIIPDHIMFRFRKKKSGNSDSVEDQKMNSENHMKTEQVNINIFKNHSTLDPLNFCKLNIASFFDENQVIQKHIKSLFKLQNKYKELQKLSFFVKFDDKLNKNPINHLNLFFQNQIIFEEFVEGLEKFLVSKDLPMIENSLTLFFEFPTITNLKLGFITSILKSVEFYFDLGEEQGTIQFQNENLRLVSYSNGLKIQMLIFTEISNYLFQLINDLKDQNIREYHLKNLNFDIDLKSTVQKEDEQNLATLLLMVNFIFKLIYQKQEKMLRFSFVNNQDAEKYQIESFYAFNKRSKIIWINFQLFQDFSLSKFLIDYLNNQTYDQSQVASQLYSVENQIIINKNQSPQLENLFKGLQNNQDQEIQVSKICGPKYVLDGKLDPRDFSSAFLLLKNLGIYIDVVQIKSAVNYGPLIKFYSQNSQEHQVGQLHYFLIYGINQNCNFEEQFNKIELLINKNNKPTTLNYYINNKKQIKFIPKIITNNIIFVSIKVLDEKVETFTLTSKNDEIRFKIHHNDQFRKQVIFIMKKLINKKITYNHVGILYEQNKQVLFKDAKYQQSNIQNISVANKRLWRIILRGIMKSENKGNQDKNKNQQPITQILEQNTISLIKENLKHQFTKCGQMRTDIFESAIKQDEEFIKNCKPCFIHAQFQQIQLIPNLNKQSFGIKLQWNPIIKGIYNLYIDQQQVQGNFIILADDVDIEKSEIIFRNPTISFTLYQELTFIIKMRDYYNNIFGGLEYELIPSDIQVTTKQQYSQPVIKKQQPTKYGLMVVTVQFIPIKEIEHPGEEVEIEIIVEKLLQKSFKLSLKGINLENRVSQFQHSLKENLVRKKIRIDRFNFLQDLEKLFEFDFKSPLQIEFKNERASDYGGPRREFYNKIGEVIKNSKYGFFIKHPERDTYFFNDAFKRIEKEQQAKWAQLFGKLIANSILNKEIIGVKFCEQLWKILFEEMITFGDLEGILEKNTFRNYNLLLTYDEETIDSFGFNFTIAENNIDVELIQGGGKTLLKKENVESYLKNIAEYHFLKKYEDIIDNFKKGFTKIIDIKKIKEWLSTNEMHTLTQGANEIEPNELLELTKFENGLDHLISFFQAYVNDMDQNKIKQFLQFMTGSPFLPWDKQVQFIVEFNATMKITHLPRTETCFYKLVIPHYETYNVFSRKLDIALTYGLEGFGMA